MLDQDFYEDARRDWGPSNVSFPASYEGHDLVAANLVLEGGAMRSMFTAGVVDVFMDNGLFFDTTIGVSAGALVGYNYIAGQRGRCAYLNLKYCSDWRGLSLKSFVKTGNAYGREFNFDLIPNEFDPYPYEAFRASQMRLIAVSSNLETGEADYHEVIDPKEEIPYLIATSSMPLVSQIVEVDGKQLVDGGTCDSIPIAYSIMTGAAKHVVVCTHPADYVRKPEKLMPLIRKKYDDYPYFIERSQNRHFDYNRAKRALVRMHDAGEAFLISPEKPIEVSNMEHDQEKLLDLYEQGVAVATKQLGALKAYLGI